MAIASVNSYSCLLSLIYWKCTAVIIICSHVQYSHIIIIISLPDEMQSVCYAPGFTQLCAPLILPFNVHLCARGITNICINLMCPAVGVYMYITCSYVSSCQQYEDSFSNFTESFSFSFLCTIIIYHNNMSDADTVIIAIIWNLLIDQPSIRFQKGHAVVAAAACPSIMRHIQYHMAYSVGSCPLNMWWNTTPNYTVLFMQWNGYK